LSTNRTPHLHDGYLSICKKQAGNQTIRIALQKWMSNPKKELMGLQIPFTKKKQTHPTTTTVHCKHEQSLL
jgi:hypothetical protein